MRDMRVVISTTLIYPETTPATITHSSDSLDCTQGHEAIGGVTIRSEDIQNGGSVETSYFRGWQIYSMPAVCPKKAGKPPGSSLFWLERTILLNSLLLHARHARADLSIPSAQI